MPIYAYKCGSCGHAKDVLQKISDAPLTACPACAAQAFGKQVTAAGFQLKGSGWYVTDFRGGSGTSSTSGESAASGAAKPADSAPGTAPASSSSSSSSDAPTASAGGCGSACGCH